MTREQYRGPIPNNAEANKGYRQYLALDQARDCPINLDGGPKDKIGTVPELIHIRNQSLIIVESAFLN